MNKVVALVDFTDVSRKVIEYGAAQAKAHGAALYLLHVEPNYSPTLYREDFEHNELLASVTKIRNQLGVEVHPVLMEGTGVEEAIVTEIEKLGADEVVLGNHHHSALHNYLFGSVGQKLMKDLNCSITLISDPVED